MDLKRYDVWLANLSPRFGTEAGKIRPVVVIQSNLLNSILPSTIVLPITSHVKLGADLLRVHLSAGMAGLEKDSDIMVEQIRAIDNARLIQKIGELSLEVSQKLEENVKIVLDL